MDAYSQTLLTFIKEYESFLNNAEKKAKKWLESHDHETRLVIRGKSKRSCQIYEVLPGPHYKYIKKSDIRKAKGIAQSSYYKNILRNIQHERKAIAAFRRAFPAVPSDQVYTEYMPDRRALVNPIYLPDTEAARHWKEKMETEKKNSNFAQPYPEGLTQTTENGEKVRSKSEVIIANSLARHGVMYEYEHPLILNNRPIFPDFTIFRASTRETIYWEHFGLLDNPVYVSNMLEKIANYSRANILPGKNLIMTFENGEHKFRSDIANLYVESYCQ
ncbi:MAG: hypothetical protein SOI56_04255 [Eubacteriales bacterium]|jgi:hypothetical protein